MNYEDARISYPTDALKFLKTWARKRQEHFIVLTLDGQHRVIKRHVVTIGILNKTLIHPRETFYKAIKDNACSIIIAHNHPSGDVTYSPQDVEVTKRLVDAGNIMGIPVLDHIIISKKDHYSFAENGMI